MKILLAADGSKFTKKALAFLVTHETLCGPEDELVVFNVQPPVPPRVKTMLGAGNVYSYQRDEAERVLEPIRKFMARHAVPTSFGWKVGHASTEIIRAGVREKSQLIVLGTHGWGFLGRALMGSVAQSVVTEAEVPVLLVK